MPKESPHSILQPLCKMRNRLETPQKTNLVDLAGKRFGRIIVLSLAHTNHGAHWNCLCDCGNEFVARGYNLTSGSTKSCGCFGREKRIETGKRIGSIKANKSRKLIIIQLNNEFKEINRFHGYIEASEQTGICKSTIIRACHSDYKNRAGGYYWKVGDSLSS